MGERGGLPIKEIPALVLDVARAQGWLDPREAASLRSALSAAREEAEAHRADLAAAAGELLVAIPSPGFDAARLLRANVLIRQERDAAREEARRLTTERDAAYAGLKQAREYEELAIEERNAAESSVRRLRESVAAYAKSCRAFQEPAAGSYLRGRYDASLAVADELDAIAARAALGSSPGPTDVHNGSNKEDE